MKNRMQNMLAALSAAIGFEKVSDMLRGEKNDPQQNHKGRKGRAPHIHGKTGQAKVQRAAKKKRNVKKTKLAARGSAKKKAKKKVSA